MAISDEILKWLRPLLVLLGLGGGMILATGAWSVPQTGGVYAALVTDTTWSHIGATVPCIWEVHPNTTKTINAVYYGSGNYTSCIQNSTDWLLWTCDSLIANAANQFCQQLRVDENEYPTISQNFFTGSVTTPNITAIPGCVGMDVCTISSPLSLASGTYSHRRIIVSSTLTLNGNVTLFASENITITGTGSLVISPGASNAFLNTLFFSNAGTISSTGSQGVASSCGYRYGDCGFGAGSQEFATCGAGSPGQAAGNLVFVGEKSVINTGTIILVGGTGANGCSWCAPCSACSSNGGLGGAGGTISYINSSSAMVNTGTINTKAGTGGRGACQHSCSEHFGSYDSNAPSANGGPGGSISGSFIDLNSTGTIITDGGNPGQVYTQYGCATVAGMQGSGGTNQFNVSRNISVTGNSSSSGGSWSVAYCANGTGMNWSEFSPAASQSALTCRLPPSFGFTTPAPSSSYTALLSNLTVNVTNSTPNISYVLQYSKDNGSTWSFITPQTVLPPGYFNNTFSFNTHRNGADSQNVTSFRELAFNNSSGIYSEWMSVNFNLTTIRTNLSTSSSPNGTLSSSAITLFCNYSNSSGIAVEAATAIAYLDGVPYNMSYNVTSSQYYYPFTGALVSGNHSWFCQISKADYQSQNSSSQQFNISGFGVIIAGGQSYVNFVCPFPTIPGMTPAYQKAGIGIFRIQNNNASALHNYSIFLDSNPPAGITVYARCDKFVADPSNYTGWTVLSTTSGYQCLSNVNSTNASAYIWLKMDCDGVTPGVYNPFSYDFTEQ